MFMNNAWNRLFFLGNETDNIDVYVTKKTSQLNE